MTEQTPGPKRKIPEPFLKQLQEDIAWRRIESGLRHLQAQKTLVDSCGSGQKGAAVLLGYLAQWVDIGFAGAGLIQRPLARFSSRDRGTLYLLEYGLLPIAQGPAARLEE